jgi:hypothetical protein
MELTSEQLESVKQGQAFRFRAPETDTEYILLRADQFERIEALVDNGLDARQTALLIAKTMQDYDQDDPFLESYQKYRP